MQYLLTPIIAHKKPYCNLFRMKKQDNLTPQVTCDIMKKTAKKE